MIQIGDRVRVGEKLLSGTVIGIIPAVADRVAMYRVLFDDAVTGPTLTPNPNERWVDEGMVYGPFVDQNIGWN